MGRPTKYTDETIAKLCQAIELGSTYELACHYAGIDYSTFNKWRDNKPDLMPRVRAAEGKAAVKWLAKIEAAAADHWQAAAWKLERRYPNDYGKTVQEQQHTGKDGTPFTIVIRRDND
jgi:transposase